MTDHIAVINHQWWHQTPSLVMKGCLRGSYLQCRDPKLSSESWLLCWQVLQIRLLILVEVIKLKSQISDLNAKTSEKSAFIKTCGYAQTASKINILQGLLLKHL